MEKRTATLKYHPKTQDILVTVTKHYETVSVTESASTHETLAQAYKNLENLGITSKSDVLWID